MFFTSVVDIDENYLRLVSTVARGCFFAVHLHARSGSQPIDSKLGTIFRVVLKGEIIAF